MRWNKRRDVVRLSRISMRYRQYRAIAVAMMPTKMARYLIADGEEVKRESTVTCAWKPASIVLLAFFSVFLISV